jgi:hypothetical protein
VRIWERSGDGLRFVNNLFVTGGGVPAVLCEARGDGVRFAGNAYWAVEGRLEIRDGAFLKNLVEWRAATGQERWRGKDVGLEANPLLRGFTEKGAVGAVGVRAAPGAFRLRAGSPLIDAGLDIDGPPATGHGGRDFWGTSVPQGPRLDIGANEYISPEK